jgi:hypothetical protein
MLVSRRTHRIYVPFVNGRFAISYDMMIIRMMMVPDQVLWPVFITILSGGSEESWCSKNLRECQEQGGA